MSADTKCAFALCLLAVASMADCPKAPVPNEVPTVTDEPVQTDDFDFTLTPTTLKLEGDRSNFVALVTTSTGAEHNLVLSAYGPAVVDMTASNGMAVRSGHFTYLHFRAKPFVAPGTYTVTVTADDGLILRDADLQIEIVPLHQPPIEDLPDHIASSVERPATEQPLAEKKMAGPAKTEPLQEQKGGRKPKQQ